MKQCTCYALRAIDCTCKPAEYGELYTSPTAKQEQGEPLEYWNAVEGWVKLDEVREHFDSVSCGTIYKNGGEGRVPLSLAQPKQEQGEPVAWIENYRPVEGGHEQELVWHKDEELEDCLYWYEPLYTHPQPKREWVGLTDEEIEQCMQMSIQKTCRAIEAKLKDKNT